MRGKSTLENVINTVHEMSVNHYDETIPVKDMVFNDLTQMWIAGEQVEVLPSAQRLLANRLRVPYSYLSRCPSNLQAENLNYWIAQERKHRNTFFCRFSGRQLRAVFTERYKAIDNLEILAKMLENGFSPAQEVQYSLDQTMLVVKVPDYERSFDVAVKDEVVPGVCLSNSEVGLLAFCIECFMYRLVCSNGLISRTSVALSRFKHISRKAIDQFDDILTQVIINSKQRQDQFLISTKTPVDNPLETIGSFNRQFKVGKNEAEAVEAAWAYEPGYSMFSVINAYTRAAQAAELTVEEAYKLERTGGQILALVKN